MPVWISSTMRIRRRWHFSMLADTGRGNFKIKMSEFQTKAGNQECFWKLEILKNYPWDVLNNFCFHVYAQKSLFIGSQLKTVRLWSLEVGLLIRMWLWWVLLYIRSNSQYISKLPTFVDTVNKLSIFVHGISLEFPISTKKKLVDLWYYKHASLSDLWERWIFDVNVSWVG